jgi:hypothetical protein
MASSALLAIPEFIAMRNATNGAAAAMPLKSSIYAAEIQFQAGGFQDRDRDGRGDFGFLPELATTPMPGFPQSHRLPLLPSWWNSPAPRSHGYHFCVYLPDGRNGALSADQDHALPQRTEESGPSGGFVAYAWPIERLAGKRIFAITQAGTIYVNDDSPFT